VGEKWKWNVQRSRVVTDFFSYSVWAAVEYRESSRRASSVTLPFAGRRANGSVAAKHIRSDAMSSLV
jgi:hypothetical protein